MHHCSTHKRTRTAAPRDSIPTDRRPHALVARAVVVPRRAECCAAEQPATPRYRRVTIELAVGA
eukprot:6173451-Pleurochrysis_carterae.AAC.5